MSNKEEKREPSPSPGTSGAQESTEKRLQEAFKADIKATVGVKTCVFYNDLLLMDPEESADLYRRGDVFIASEAADYGSDAEDNPRAVIRQLQAVYREIYRLSCLMNGHPPFSVLPHTHKELFFIVAAYTHHIVGSLRIPAHLAPLSEAEKLMAKDTLDRLLSISRAATGIVMGAQARAMADPALETIKALLHILGSADDPPVVPTLLKRLKAYLSRHPDEAQAVLQEAAFPGQQVIDDAYEGVIPLGTRPFSTYPEKADNTHFLINNCPKAQYLADNDEMVHTQTLFNFPEEAKCDHDPCKFDMAVIHPSDLHPMDDESQLMPHYPASEAKLDANLRKGRFDCSTTAAANVYNIYKDTPQEDIKKILHDTNFLKDIHRYQKCSIVFTPWTQAQLDNRQTRGEPENGFTTISFGTMTDKILVVHANYLGEGYAPECEIPDELVGVLQTKQVVKTGFGVVNESRLKTLGITVVNVVDLSNLVILAYPQTGQDPAQMQNSMTYFLHQAKAGFVPYMNKSARRASRKGSKRSTAASLLTPKKVEGVNAHLFPDVDDFSQDYSKWSVKMKKYVIVSHHAYQGLVVKLALKCMQQANLGKDANVMPFVHWLLCLAEGQPRFGVQAKSDKMMPTPFGRHPVEVVKPGMLNASCYYPQAPSAFLNAGNAIVRSLDNYERQPALDPHCIDAAFSIELEKIVGPLSGLNFMALIRLLFRRTQYTIHPCSHCGSSGHSEPTPACLELEQICVYPQCFARGHNLSLCPVVMHRCEECGKLGHRPIHHDKPMPQLQMEFLYAALLHFHFYRISINARIRFFYCDFQEGKFQIMTADHPNGLSLGSLPAKPHQD